LRFIEIGIDEPDGAQHRSTGCLLYALDH
jgi:hypothetical protein